MAVSLVDLEVVYARGWSGTPGKGLVVERRMWSSCGIIGLGPGELEMLLG
jgi:hypothetical protein